MSKSEKWLSINFFAFFFTWGVFLPFWTGWLTTEKGLSVSHASIIMGAGMFARAFSTFILFQAATKRYSIRNVMLWTAFLSLVLMALYIPANTPGNAFLGMTLCTIPAILIVLFTRKKFTY